MISEYMNISTTESSASVPHEYSRRDVLRGSLAILPALLVPGLASCSANPGQLESQKVERSGITYRNAVDASLDAKPDRGITHVVFRYLPERAGGSISAVVQLNPPSQDGPEWLRFVAHEQRPNPGYLSNEAYRNDGIDPNGTVFEKFPVDELGREDEQRVFIGVGPTKEGTYQAMRTYNLKPITSLWKSDRIIGLEGSFTGYNLLQPPLKMRRS